MSDSNLYNNIEEYVGNGKNKIVKCKSGLIIGNGEVIPELNFPIPPMLVNLYTWKEIIDFYKDALEKLFKVIPNYSFAGFVIEFEQLPAMTINPDWGGRITEVIKEYLNSFQNSSGIPAALRVTIVDSRDSDKPPILRNGQSWERMKQSFISVAEAGADILSIESIGGKEVHDVALLDQDIQSIATTLGSLASSDVSWLWKEIRKITDYYGCIAGGDSACGFANHAMFLSRQNYIFELLSTIVRIASIPRSLSAYLNGAIGPSKGCSYESTVIKAILGIPISIEEKSSCCNFYNSSNFSDFKAIDLWNRYSITNSEFINVKSLQKYFEQLNSDISQIQNKFQIEEHINKNSKKYRTYDLILKYETIIELSRCIDITENSYSQTLRVIQKAIDIIKNEIEIDNVILNNGERNYFKFLYREIKELELDENIALEKLFKKYSNLFNKESYGLF